MKLYSEDSSPFSAPVRLAIYAKGLDIAIEPPPGGLLSTTFHAINPLGTIPCLMLEDGTPLPESTAILEYLEDKFPSPSLRPETAEARARMRVLQRIGELQIITPLIALHRQRDPAARDQSTGNQLTRLVRGLSSLNVSVGNALFADGPSLSLADCELAPALFLVPKICTAFDKPDLLNAYESIGRYIESVGCHPAVCRVLAEMAPTWGVPA